MTAEEMAHIEAFDRQLVEFCSNFQDLKNSGLTSEWFMELQPDGSVKSSGLGVSRHRLKGFLLDYRKFHSQREPVHFFRICNIVTRRCRDMRFHDAVELNREKWKNPETLAVGWRNKIGVAEFVDAMFNQELFHLDTPPKNHLNIEAIQQSLGPEAVQGALFFVAYDRLLVLRNLRWLIQPLIQGEAAVRLPFV